MIAQADFSADIVSPHASASVAADALTRIPSRHFRDMHWAKESIATCTAMLAQAAGGDTSGVPRWISEAGSVCGEQPLYSVLCAVGDSIVADAFRSRSDISAVSAFITSVERDVLGRLNVARRQKESTVLSDPATAELAAGLVRIVQMHDRDTAVHLEATAALARRIAITMQLPLGQVMTVELAARLHDIGKVGVTRDVLTKPGALTEREWTEVRQHSESGAAALADTPNLAFLAPLVRAHHERMDGTGYPDRLRGAEIPLESRVIAVADAFHAMTTDRPYRKAMMPNDALAILADNAGTQFDADVVEATFVLFRYTRRSRRRIA